MKRLVKAFVIVMNGTDRSMAQTTIYPMEGFHAGAISDLVSWNNFVQSGEKTGISVDYILFSDGTSWGTDSLRRAGRINEYLDGRKAAIDNLTTLLFGIVQSECLMGINSFIDIIQEPIGDHEPTKPGLSFQERGYEVVVNGLRGGVELQDIKTKLRAMEKHPSP